ncbi:endonuclease/exonuclease/phosphatase family protein [Actinoplanes sp. NPDC049316]|uniref:endonuclease/exonuclease/phosphatase family protein n=1 Tax=Actinoplanes sp. NPDC049316 TaxID=3154727 RepID=UPI003417D947
MLTLNVQNDAGDPRWTPLLRREIARCRPDLVALQEVRRRPADRRPAGPWCGLSDHAGVLAGLLVSRGLL